jgi:hypothetical protein
MTMLQEQPVAEMAKYFSVSSQIKKYSLYSL